MDLMRLCCGASILIAVLTGPALGQDKPTGPAAPKPSTATKSQSGSAKSQKPSAAKPSAPAQSGMTAEEASAGVAAMEEIFACVSQGLPQGWERAWVTVTELSGDSKERTFEGRFQVSLEASGDKRWDFVPCNSRQVAESVYRLNDFLAPEKRGWKVATLLFLRGGKFELKYDYTR